MTSENIFNKEFWWSSYRRYHLDENFNIIEVEEEYIRPTLGRDEHDTDTYKWNNLCGERALMIFTYTMADDKDFATRVCDYKAKEIYEEFKEKSKE